MADKSIQDYGKEDIIEAAESVKDKARTDVPATVAVSIGGMQVGAVAFGPAGGVLGATVGSGIGALYDKGYLDEYEEKAEELYVDLKD